MCIVALTGGLVAWFGACCFENVAHARACQARGVCVCVKWTMIIDARLTYEYRKSAGQFGFQPQRPINPAQAIYARTPAPPEKDPAYLPSLASDPLSATITLPAPAAPDTIENSTGRKQGPSRDDAGPSQKANERSLLVVGDTSGHLHLFLDGFYPLGSIFLGDVCQPLSVHIPPLPDYDPATEQIPDAKLVVFASKHTSIPPSASPGSSTPVLNGWEHMETNTGAALYRLPLLHLAQTRDMARSSSTAKELLSYMTLIVHEMHDSWAGTATREGASGTGAKWLQHLEQMQLDHGDGKNGFFLL